MKKWKHKNFIDSLIIFILTGLLLVVIGIGAVFINYPWEDENVDHYFLSNSFKNIYERYAHNISRVALDDIVTNGVVIENGSEFEDEINFLINDQQYYRESLSRNPRIFYKIYNGETGDVYSETPYFDESLSHALVISKIKGDQFKTTYYGSDLKKANLPYTIDNNLNFYHGNTLKDVISKTPVQITFGIVSKDAIKGQAFDDEINQSYNEFLLMKNIGRYFDELTIALVIACFIIILLIIAALNRRARYVYPQDVIDRIPNDIKLALVGLGMVLVVMVFDNLDIPKFWYRSSLDGTQQIFYALALLVVVYLMVVALISLGHALIAKQFIKQSITFKILHVCYRGIRSFFEAIFRNVILQKKLIMYSVLTFVIILFNVIFALGNSSFLFFMLIPDLWVTYIVFKIIFSIGHISKVMQERQEGMHENFIDKTKLLKMFHPLADQINNTQLGLNEAVEKAIKGEKLKTELITNVSHDLKTPLTSIINYVSLLKKMDLENDEAKAYVSVIDKKSNRLKVLIEDILDVSKISTGNVEINLESIDLNQMMLQMIGEFEERFKQIPLNLIHTDFSDLYVVKADAEKLKRILENIFSNVEKYALENTRVYISTQKMNAFTQLEVKNISKDYLEGDSKLFLERFMRGDTSRSTEGSGLGLAIANDLAVLMKGHLEIEVDGDLFKVKLTLENGQVSQTELYNKSQVSDEENKESLDEENSEDKAL